MKRFWLPALVVMLIALLPPTNATVAGQEQPKPLPTPEWKQKDGFWKTDLGSNLPEVVILKLSDADYRKDFGNKDKKRAKKYIDTNGFLKAPLIQVNFGDVCPGGKGKDWYIVIGHTLHSTASIIAWQETEGKSVEGKPPKCAKW